MDGRVASGKALGFGAFAIGAWMYSVVSAGWYGMEMLASTTWQSVSLFATVLLLVVALASFLRDERWHAAFFAFWAAVFWGGRAGAAEAPDAYGAWYFLWIAVFTFLLWLRAQKSADVGTPAALVALGTWLAFVGWALQAWGFGTIFAVIAGYVGLLTAVVSFWAVADALGVFAAAGGGGSTAPAGGGGSTPRTGGGGEF